MKAITKILCAILITSMLLTFSSCVKPKSKLSPKQIKATVMAEMNSDQDGSVQSPYEIFEAFLGDFTIESPTTTGSLSDDIKRAYLKDGVYVVEHNSGEVSYESVYEGYLFSLKKERSGKISVVGCTQLGEDYKNPPSVLEYLAIDISSVYPSASSDETEALKDIPTLTEDMLTVSKDRSTCTFSADYMNQLAKVLFDVMNSDSDEETDVIEATGVYKVTENAYEFVIAGVSKSFEYRRITINFSNSEENGINVYMKMEFPVSSNGMTLPTVAEMSVKDITYVDNKPVKATIESKYTVSEAKGKIQGYDYTVNSKSSSCFTLDITNEASPKLTGTITNDQTVTVDGETNTHKSEKSIECVFSDGADSMLKFSQTVVSNGDTTHVSMKSSNLKRGAPEGVSIPNTVHSLIKKQYADIKK